MRQGHVTANYELFEPRVNSWATIYIDDIQIPFEEALQIANENGGQTYIDKYDGDCSIEIDLFPKRGNKLVWEVRYLGPEWYVTKDFVELSVDAVTGEVIEME